MLTVLTQAAISVLHDISLGACLQSANFQLSEEELSIPVSYTHLTLPTN